MLKLYPGLHRAACPVEVSVLATVDGDWAGLVERQRAVCVAEQVSFGLAQEWAEQVSFGLAQEWAEQVPGFLEAVALRNQPRVLLHTEIMRQHLMVVPDPWRLSGLVDFEPTMPGPVSTSSRRSAPLGPRATLASCVGDCSGAANAAGALDVALRRRMLAWALLHRYSYPGGLAATAARAADADA